MWEYTCVPVLMSDGGHDASLRLMNALGAEGWEAFAVGPAPRDGGVQYLYAKRRVNEGSQAAPQPMVTPDILAPAVGGKAETHVTLASRIHSRNAAAS